MLLISPLKSPKPNKTISSQTNKSSTLLSNYQCTPDLSLPQLPLVHPLFTPTQSVQEFPLERQTQIIGHRFFWPDTKGPPIHSCAAVYFPFSHLSSPLVASPSMIVHPPSDKSWADPRPKNTAPFHCHNKATETHASHDPDPKTDPDFLCPEASGTTNRTLNL